MRRDTLLLLVAVGIAVAAVGVSWPSYDFSELQEAKCLLLGLFTHKKQ